MRQLDRKANGDHYPRLSYPELYILEGGYSEFFKDYPSYCEPQSYISMDAEEFREECEFYSRRMRNLGTLVTLQREVKVRPKTAFEDRKTSPGGRKREQLSPSSPPQGTRRRIQ
jgi:M-phase inducer tyrosine phosphatase